MRPDIEVREDGVWVRLNFEEAGSLSAVVNTTCDNLNELVMSMAPKPNFAAIGLLNKLEPVRERLDTVALTLRELLANDPAG